MSNIPLLPNENERQAVLETYHILDTASEQDFDDIAELASAICDTPIALIGFIDDKRHWFKARKGTALTESGKDISFCAHAIAEPQEIMVVPDATLDPRFAQSPVVTGMNLSFYAGVPLVNRQGYALGTLCVLDQKPKQLTTQQQMALKVLGRQVMDKLELRKKLKELEAANLQISAMNVELDKYKSDLQSANEEAAVVNEELRTTNEELFSINEQLTASKQRLADALEQTSLAKQAAKLGLFDLDVARDILVWDDRCKELFGVSAEKQVTYSTDFVSGLHPEDKERTLQAVAAAYNKQLTGGRYDIEYRTIGADDGLIRHVRAIGQVFFDETGQPQRFIGTVMDITEEKRDEQRKNDFIGMVSHELKTPLTSMNGYIQMLLLKAKRNEDHSTAGILDKANKQISKMTIMINGFLNVSRLESGKIHMDLKVFDMAELVKEVEEESIATISTHKVVFAPVVKTLVHADRDKIGQVINNLISNAVKYSPPDSTIQVACVTKDGMAHVSVQDEGAGIAEEDREKLFERYYRVKTEHTKSIAGFGIGLYLCKEIIDRHKGQIGVRSKIGAGSIFWFTLPVEVTQA
ncbi:hypothetical protein GCM10027037_20830 [Mucilaginibacter koreensis]